MKERNASYRIERLTEKNISDLVFLFEKSGNGNFSISYFEKKFATDWTGHKFIGFFAYSESDEPAAFYGVFPCFVYHNGKKILACQSGDTITNVNHRNKGLFVLLANRTFDLAKSLGVEVVFGFPNENSYHGFMNKLGWKRLNDCKYYAINVHSFPLYSLLNKFPATKVLYRLFIRFILLFIGSSKVFSNSISQIKDTCVEHDLEFNKYKAYSKLYKVKLFRYHFWLKFSDGLVIGDIDGFEVNKTENFMKAIKFLGRIMGVKKVRFICSEGSVIDQVLSERYRPDHVYPFAIKELNQLTISSFVYSGIDIDTF